MGPKSRKRKVDETTIVSSNTDASDSSSTRAQTKKRVKKSAKKATNKPSTKTASKPPAKKGGAIEKTPAEKRKETIESRKKLKEVSAEAKAGSSVTAQGRLTALEKYDRSIAECYEVCIAKNVLKNRSV